MCEKDVLLQNAQLQLVEIKGKMRSLVGDAVLKLKLEKLEGGILEKLERRCSMMQRGYTRHYYTREW
jgi:hypothetical protein